MNDISEILNQLGDNNNDNNNDNNINQNNEVILSDIISTVHSSFINCNFLQFHNYYTRSRLLFLL